MMGMNHKEILEELRKKKIDEGLYLPHYERYSIANLVSSVLRHFGLSPLLEPYPLSEIIELNTKDKIVLFILDALGYNLYKRIFNHLKAKFKILGNIEFFPMSSVFPTTTASALTTLNTGLTPLQHGMVGYILFLKEFGLLANMIELTPVGMERDLLIKLGLNPMKFMNNPTIHELLKEGNVGSFTVTASVFKNTGFNKMHTNGSNVKTYQSFSDLFSMIRRILKNNKDEKLLLIAYWGLADTLGHRKGPLSDEYESEVFWILRMFEEEVLNKIPPSIFKKTLFLITGDHGQKPTRWEDEIWLISSDEFCSKLSIPPTGEQRMMYLFTKNKGIFKEFFEEKYKERAILIDSSYALEIGLFGFGEIHSNLIDRIGDFVLLAKGAYSFNYKYTGQERSLKGKHGSLSEDELFVPLIPIG
ncbi:MAG: alkaline phosphatase family protein [Thermotogae bacterium]|nr:alkaline phosphatase family protein [Thermotogota bacterium]